MRKGNIVWRGLWASAKRLRNDLGPVLEPLRTAKVVISFETSFENVPMKKEAPKSSSDGLQDASQDSFDLHEGLKRGPQTDSQDTVCAQKRCKYR